MVELTDRIRVVNQALSSGDKRRIDSAIGELTLALRRDLPTDPLLCATCLALVDDPDLVADLTVLAADARHRTGRANALVVDVSGRGSVVEVVLELSPGGSGVWSVQDFGRDADVAAQLAIAVALGPQLQRWGVRWHVKSIDGSPGFQLRGTSIGVAVAVATQAALTGRVCPQQWAFTGGVDLDGTLSSVSSVPAKVRAAADQGLKRVGLPAVDSTGLAQPEGCVLVGAPTLSALFEDIWPQTSRSDRKRIRWALALSVLPALVAFTSVFDGAELLIQRASLSAILGPLPIDNSIVLALPVQGDRRALRGKYPGVIDRLIDVGATAIVFDVLFLSETEDDQSFAAAINRAQTAGVPVVIPSRWQADWFEDPVSTLNVRHESVVWLEQERLFGQVRRFPVLLTDRDGGVRWNLPVAALAAHVGAEPVLTEEGLAIGVTRNPTVSQRIAIPPAERIPRLGWDDDDWSEAMGRVVFIGAIATASDAFRTLSGDRYGVEVHAAALETLARQESIRLTQPGEDAVIAALVTTITAWFALMLPTRRRRLCLAIPALTLGIAMALITANVVVAVCPIVLGGVVGCWVGHKWSN